jgi:hypothetical protein
MWRKLIALVLTLAVPAGASAGPLKDAVDKAARELALTEQNTDAGGRGRFWTGIALIGGGGVLATLGALELGDDETGPDDGEDLDDSDDGEDSDGWGNNALLGGGIAAATIGGILLMTGRKSGPVLSVRPGRVTVGQTVRF